MPFIENKRSDRNPAERELPVDEDVRRAPTGVYSGMTKRLAISDGQFVDVHGDVEADYRNKSRLSD